MMYAFTTEVIKIEDIKVKSGFNARSNLGKITGLVESIGTIGVQQPLGVKKLAKGKYSLIYGFRRIEAARVALLDEVPCRVYPLKTKQKDLFLLNLQENVTRQSLNPVDESRAIKRLIDLKMVDKDIYDALGISKSKFTQRKKVIGYPDAVQEALRTDSISIYQARQIVTLPEDRKERFIEIAKEMPIKKFGDLVEREHDKIESINNPEILGGGDEEEEEQQEPEQVADPAEVHQVIVDRLCDIVVSAFTNESDQADGILTVKSVKWQDLALTDMEYLEVLFTRVCEYQGWLGNADDGEEDFDEESSLDSDEDEFEELEDMDDVDEEYNVVNIGAA